MQIDNLYKRFDQKLQELHGELIDFRRDLHRHPELSGQEERTAGLVTARLEKLNFEVVSGVGGYGLVALSRGGKPGPVVAFRADMDAVRSSHPDPVSFTSLNPGVRHICGHDIHTTVAVALAEGFATIRDQLPGSVLFIFQPAEENATGAEAMISDGALEHHRPEAIYSFHTAPLEVGKIGSKPGVMLAGRDRVKTILRGQKDLRDFAQTVERAINNISTIASDVGSVKGDFIKARVFRSRAYSEPNSWEIWATITTTSADMSAKAKDGIDRVLRSLATQDISYTLDYRERVIAGVTNDPGLETASHAPIRSVVGDTGLVELETIPAFFSEDFGSFQTKVPGVMYFLGVSNTTKGWVGMPHTPDYVADEASIFIGAKVMSAVILNYMVTHPR